MPMLLPVPPSYTLSCQCKLSSPRYNALQISLFRLQILRSRPCGDSGLPSSSWSFLSMSLQEFAILQGPWIDLLENILNETLKWCDKRLVTASRLSLPHLGQQHVDLYEKNKHACHIGTSWSVCTYESYNDQCMCLCRRKATHER